MRSPSAALMPGAWLVMGLFGAFASDLSAHAELILGPNIDGEIEAAQGIGEAAYETLEPLTQLSAGAAKTKPDTSAATKPEISPEPSPPARPEARPETAATHAPLPMSPRAQTLPRSGRMSTQEAPRNDDESSLAYSLTALESDLPRRNGEIADELKEIVRPLYDELATSGVVDAVQGIKSYLEPRSTNTAAALNGLATSDAHGAGEPPYPRTYGGKYDGMEMEKSAEQIEKEKMIAALIIDEWIATIKPWLFALIALFLLWRLVKFGFQVVHWKTGRARRRAAKSRHRRGARAG